MPTPQARRALRASAQSNLARFRRASTIESGTAYEDRLAKSAYSQAVLALGEQASRRERPVNF